MCVVNKQFELLEFAEPIIMPLWDSAIGSALDFNFVRSVVCSILTAGKS